MFSKPIIVALALAAVAMVCTAEPITPPADGVYQGIGVFDYKRFNLQSLMYCHAKCLESSDCKAYSFCGAGLCDLSPFDLTSDEITARLLNFQKLHGRDLHKVETIYPNGRDHKNDKQLIVRDDNCKLYTKV